ncbi:MAG: bifunctional 5,10-methylenetetrahydrofolate dehydrogenase/5,10-methenyltetrahydrofolate cyclohydrolase [Bacteriovoracaceae bacterium]|jgi:methylenetetrahydrofolate dehydrogenase (NADP+)/methenyltetrahydrofolate cyclohydrolase
MTTLLKAQPVVDQKIADLTKRCQSLIQKGKRPLMKVVLVGNNPASLTYIRHKKKMCETIGAEFELDQLDSSISKTDFLAHVEKLNQDSKVTGIIIQLPVSNELKSLRISQLVTPAKDIDGFHGHNTQWLYEGSIQTNHLLPCTPKGIVELLDYYQIPLKGKHAVVIGRSLIVGKPLSMLLSNRNATVTLAHSKTENLVELTKMADIIISAVGKAELITAKHINPAKKTVVIDVGMNTLHDKLVGDVKFDEVSPLVAAISPVPGGVGPMTVISLIENLILASEKQS